MNQTNWLPGIIVLAGGLLLAVVYLFASRKQAAKPRDGVLEELERRAQMLIEQLRELSADRHHLTDEQFAAEKARLELEAAAALRARDEHTATVAKKAAAAAERPAAAAAKAAAAPTGFFGRHPELKGALWGGGVVLFFVVMGLLLSQSTQERGENDSITGKDPSEAAGTRGMAQDGPATDEEQMIRAAIDEVKKNPENVEAAAEVGHALIWRQRWDDAASLTERALATDPFHIETRIHRAALEASRGNPEGAIQKLQHLADTFPDAYEALLFIGMISMQGGDNARALESFERYAAETPASEQPPQLMDGIAILREKLGVHP